MILKINNIEIHALWGKNIEELLKYFERKKEWSNYHRAGNNEQWFTGYYMCCKAAIARIKRLKTQRRMNNRERPNINQQIKGEMPYGRSNARNVISRINGLWYGLHH